MEPLVEAAAMLANGVTGPEKPARPTNGLAAYSHGSAGNWHTARPDAKQSYFLIATGPRPVLCLRLILGTQLAGRVCSPAVTPRL